MADECGVRCPSRRAVLAGTGAGVTALLAGCQTYGEPAGPAAGGPPPSAGGGGATPAAGQPRTLATVADIPVGGGKIFAAEGVVVTRPTEGSVKAFSATCTHQGCTVTEVRDGAIVCACHNSAFDIDDGSVKGGPARQPLPPAAVSVDGTDIRLG
ncbi:Rieske (2Fe-2S) protein [Micromonospora sp. CPCC 205556]|uniref:Rieske (2Fe-2S) protein n=1 Tax=Micromonospora sp. CPCC 205556 TaxID=3122398 RepID=UPI002FEF608C